MKKIYTGAIALMAGVLVLAVSPIQAADTGERKNYTQVKIGYFQPTGQLDDDGYDNGGDLSVVYGRYLTPYLSLEAGIDIFGTENDFDGYNSTTGNYDQDSYMSAAGAILTLKAEYPVGPVRLYGGGGFGIYQASLYSEIDTSRLGDFDKTETDSMLGAHFIAGVDWDITERFFLSLEGKYRITEDVDIDETVATIPVRYDGDLDGYTIAAGVGFRF